MLKKKDILNKIDNKYWEMIDQLDIGNLYKCLAQFSGLKPNELQDEVVYNMIETWTKNKYRFFVMLGNKLSIDTDFSYNRVRTDIEDEVLDLSKQYLIYTPWLRYFNSCSSNIIDIHDMGCATRETLRTIFPNVDLDNMKITHFFKKYLSAPEELVTAIGKIFENDKVNTKYTISIDPVEMMLASETPYDWDSCYRLELDRCESHADGCAAAMLDTKSLITYLWTSKGKYTLYNTYDFKEIKYKRMRAWIAISDDFNIVHFNDIYPKKNELTDEFQKTYRDVVETLIAHYLNVDNKWGLAKTIVNCYRQQRYGYGEYFDNHCFCLKSYREKIEEELIRVDLEVFDEKVPSLDGDGMLPPSDEDNEYNGNGFLTSNFEDRYWCDDADDYCEYNCYGGAGECECEDCPYWQNAHPRCELDDSVYCPNPDYFNVEDGFQMITADHCSGCEHYENCHPVCHIDEVTPCKDADPEYVHNEVQMYCDHHCEECARYKEEYAADADESSEDAESQESELDQEEITANINYSSGPSLTIAANYGNTVAMSTGNDTLSISTDDIMSSIFGEDNATLVKSLTTTTEENMRILEYVHSHPDIFKLAMGEGENNNE